MEVIWAGNSQCACAYSLRRPIAHGAETLWVVKVEQWHMPAPEAGRPFQTGWKCTVRWNYEQAAVVTDYKKAKAQRLAYEKALVTVGRKVVCQPCFPLPSACGSCATCPRNVMLSEATVITASLTNQPRSRRRRRPDGSECESDAIQRWLRFRVCEQCSPQVELRRVVACTAMRQGIPPHASALANVRSSRERWGSRGSRCCASVTMPHLCQKEAHWW